MADWGIGAGAPLQWVDKGVGEAVAGDDYKYWAFISYSHRNLDWAKWLQRALERYHVPRRLVGRAGADGPLPRRLYPVFRDQEELSSGPSLSAAIDQALVASRHLIVIASPHAAVSHWVDKEIQRFRALGRGDRILCLIVDGDPQTDSGSVLNTLQCMPPSLRRQTRLQDGYEPIAADVRPGHETRDAARIRLIAGLLGVGFDELRQRDERRRRWQLGGWIAASIALLALLALFGHDQQVRREEALAQQAQRVHLRLVMERARDEMLEHHPARAAVYLAEAYRLGVNSRVLRYWLGRAMEYVDARRQVMDTGAPVQLIRFGHTPNTLLSMGEDTHLQLWDVATARKRIDIDAGGKRSFCQLSVDDRIIACTMGEDFDQLKVWDTISGQTLMALPIVSLGTASTLFRAGHHVLAVIAPDHHPELHDVDAPAKILRLPIEATAITFDRSGGRLLVGTETGEISIWDAETGRLLKHFARMEAPVFWLDTTPDGSRIGASDIRSRLRIWDTATGRIRLSSGHSGIRPNIRFDQPGASLISEASDGVRVWDTETGALKFALKTNVGNSLESQLAPDGSLIYSSGVGEMHAHRVDASMPTYAVDGHRSPANDMAFSPDGQLLATGSTDGRVIVWNLPRQPVFEFPHGTARPQAFTNDQIAGGVGIYSHDGRSIATASTDGAVRVWDAATHALIWQFDDVDPLSVDVLAFSDDDQILAVGGDSGGIQLWSLPDGKLLRKLDTGDAGPLWIRFSGDRLAAAWTGHQSGLWQLSDGQPIGAWSRDGGAAQALTPDGTAFVVGSKGRLTLRSTVDAAERWSVEPAAGDDIAAVAYSRDGRVLAVADKAHQLMTLDAATGQRLAGITIPAGVQTYAIAISDDGQVIAQADDNRDALLWWPATQRIVKLRGHAGTVISIAFSPDQQLVLTSSTDATARLWDAKTGELVEAIAGHAQTFATSPFVGARFSPDGSKVLTASIDGVVREWNVPDETRSPQMISAAVACSSPWQLDGEMLVPVLPPAGQCH